jgi:hypothetical protein
MPLTDKGNEIKNAMTKQYGAKKGEQVFYASKNKGTISGVDDEAGEGEGSEVESWAGLMSDEDMTMSDEDLGVAMDRFDALRDKAHALDRRCDDCEKRR